MAKEKEAVQPKEEDQIKATARGFVEAILASPKSSENAQELLDEAFNLAKLFENYSY